LTYRRAVAHSAFAVRIRIATPSIRTISAQLKNAGAYWPRTNVEKVGDASTLSHAMTRFERPPPETRAAPTIWGELNRCSPRKGPSQKRPAALLAVHYRGFLGQVSSYQGKLEFPDHIDRVAHKLEMR
jgi:hypothetical protein